MSLSNSKKEKNIIILAEENNIVREKCEETIIKVLNEFDESKNFEIFSLKDGYEILSIYLNKNYQQRIKLIITSEVLKYFNGSSTIKFIREFENTKKKKSVRIASLINEEKDIKEYLLKNQVDQVFVKPLFCHEFVLALGSFDIIIEK